MPAALPACYRDAALAVARKPLSRCGNVSQGPGLVSLHADRGGLRLAAAVDPATHLVRDARHGGAASDVEAAIMDLLCDILTGTPIQEVADHGAIHLEHRLRDREQSPAVQGIVMPANAAPIFGIAEQLCRQLRDHYRVQTGYDVVENTFIRRAKSNWTKLPIDHKLSMLQQAMLDSVAGLAANGLSVEFVRLDGTERVTIRIIGATSNADQEALISRLEAVLKDKVDAGIQLYLESLEDMNKGRSLQ